MIKALDTIRQAIKQRFEVQPEPTLPDQVYIHFLPYGMCELRSYPQDIAHPDHEKSRRKSSEVMQ